MRTRDWYSLGATVVFLGLCILFSGGIYQTVTVGNVSLVRLNRFTGGTWIIGPGGVVEVRYEAFERAQRAAETKTTVNEGRGYRLAWEDVLKDPEFQSLGAPEKEQVLRGYFSEHVDADPEFQTAIAKDPSIRDTVWRNMWRTLKQPVPKP